MKFKSWLKVVESHQGNLFGDPVQAPSTSGLQQNLFGESEDIAKVEVEDLFNRLKESFKTSYKYTEVDFEHSDRFKSQTQNLDQEQKKNILNQEFEKMFEAVKEKIEEDIIPILNYKLDVSGLNLVNKNNQIFMASTSLSHNSMCIFEAVINLDFSDDSRLTYNLKVKDAPQLKVGQSKKLSSKESAFSNVFLRGNKQAKGDFNKIIKQHFTSSEAETGFSVAPHQRDLF